MVRKLSLWAAMLAVSSLVVPFSMAQEFVKMSDEQFIELAIDLVRKGVQQEDTTKVFQVFAPEVTVRGQEAQDKALLSQRLQAVFDNGSERTISLERPMFSREDHPLSTSDFWDFDILDPHISINGDTAIVSCELVLWGAAGDAETPTGGLRSRERFTLVSPPRAELDLGSEEYSTFPVSTPASSSQSGTRGWMVVGCENLLDFLQYRGRMSNTEHHKVTGEE